MSLADEKYMSVTTYKKDGTPKPGPVWPVDAGDGRVGFVTSSKTWKIRRLRNNPRVEVQPSDSRGNVAGGTSPVSGTAEIVTGAGFEAMHVRVKAKYGYQLALINGLHLFQRLLRRGGHDNDCAVIITLNSG